MGKDIGAPAGWNPGGASSSSEEREQRLGTQGEPGVLPGGGGQQGWPGEAICTQRLQRPPLPSTEHSTDVKRGGAAASTN